MWYADYEPETELLTSEERALVLNIIDETLEENNINLEVAGYEDLDGAFFGVQLWKRVPDKPIKEGELND